MGNKIDDKSAPIIEQQVMLKPLLGDRFYFDLDKC
jgi:hypothetical protein